jgi:hypothetical protein
MKTLPEFTQIYKYNNQQSKIRKFGDVQQIIGCNGYEWYVKTKNGGDEITTSNFRDYDTAKNYADKEFLANIKQNQS